MLQIIEEHSTNLSFLYMALKEVKKAESRRGSQVTVSDEPSEDDIKPLSSLLAKALTTPSSIEYLTEQLLRDSWVKKEQG